MQVNFTVKHIIKESAILLVFIAVIFFPFFHNLESRSFHGDENNWIITSKYFKLFFIDRDFHNEQWNEWFTYDQPSVGRYIIGLSLFINGGTGRFDEVQRIPLWDFSRDIRWNKSAGAVPQNDILYAARFPMAILGGLTCLLIFLAGKMIFNRQVGIIAALLLAYNPLMLMCSQRAMADAPLIFFMTAAMVTIIPFYHSLIKKKFRGCLCLSLLIGLNVALATGTKLNGAIAGIVFGTFCILLLTTKMLKFFNNPKGKSVYIQLITNSEIKIILSSLILAGLSSFIVFVSLNPHLYSQPFKGSLKMVEHRLDTVKEQQSSHPAIKTIPKKVYYVVGRTLYDKSYSTLKHFFKIPLDLILFIIGLIILTYTEVKYLFNKDTLSPQSIIIIWTFITYLGIIIWIPLDWDRYYLPLVPCVAMISGYSIERISQRGLHWAKIPLGLKT